MVLVLWESENGVVSIWLIFVKQIEKKVHIVYNRDML